MTDPPGPGLNNPVPAHGGSAELISDADRDHTVTLLREHVVAGRLTLEEFSDRVGLALEGRTRGDLDTTLANLPSLAVPEREAARRRPRRWFVAVMSGSRPQGRWRIGARTTAVAVMGGCAMDLRHAEIEGSEIVITAIAFWGGIKVTVPEGFGVELGGFSLMGGRDLKLRDVPLVRGSPLIRIRGFALMGGIHVRSRPSRVGRGIGMTIIEHVVGSVSDALPALADSAGGPIDVEALSRQIRDQLRAQSRAVRRSRDDSPARQPTDASVSPAAVGEGTVTILFSDMVDYAGMTERLGDQTSRELLRTHHGIVRDSLQRHGGREIKVQGDGFMMAFGGVARALRCAADIQRSLLEHSESSQNLPIRVHIGVHTGEVVEEGDDFLGHTVIVASRLADAARPGEILVSELSAQLVERTGEFRFVDHREATLKGLTRPQSVATLTWKD